MEFVPLLVMSALVKKLVDFAKYATSKDTNAVVTQLVSWAAGVAVTFLAASSDWADTVVMGGLSLGTLNSWSLLFVGLNLSSVAGVGWDFLKAVDNNNSAAVPDLLTPHGTGGPVEPTL